MRRQHVADCEDQVWLEPNHIVGQLAIMLCPPLAGISLHNQVPPLDITEPTQFPEECSESKVAGFAHLSDRGRWVNQGDAVDLACCARAASGHATAAPPSVAKNSRRRM